MFNRKGYITVGKDRIGEDELMEKALDAGAVDLQSSDDTYEIYTEFADLESVRAALEKNSIEITSVEPAMIPQNTIKLDGKRAEQMLRLYEALEEHDDVVHVYANFDIDESIMEKMSEG
jgi:transcriptional/translational regulatory protein YebC/TACO1